MRGPAGACTCAVLKVSNIAQVQKDLDAWIKGFEKESVAIVKNYAAQTFHILLGRSPQFSGDFVANWNISLNVPDTSFRRFKATRTDPMKRGRSFDTADMNYKRGDKPAMTEAKMRNEGALQGYIHGDRIVMTNASFHNFGRSEKRDYYAKAIEADHIKWRAGNETAGHPAAKTKLWMGTRYATLNRSTVAKMKMEL